MTSKETLYFAYGSNLNKADWNERTAINFDDAFEKVSCAWLPNFCLAFTRYAGSRGGGVLDVIVSPGSVAGGVLFTVKGPGAWEELDEKEGVGGGCYERREVNVLLPDGSYRRAITYVVVDSRDTEGKPFFYQPSKEKYLDIVREGLRAHGLAEDELDRAARNEAPAPLSSFFCYGTLRRGECRYVCLEPLGIREERTGTIVGSIFDLGSYPGLKVVGGDSNRVVGELITLEKTDEALRALDRIEGFDPEREGSLYLRTVTTVTLEDGEMRAAWVYVYNDACDPSARIASGDWRNR
ncbi:MAG: gamma-glutamylcyclotransferase [Thermoguttaceae bacterium]|nr:gamma-glutamylcyclotransferase [Thermoguttaceae bacterium]